MCEKFEANSKFCFEKSYKLCIYLSNMSCYTFKVIGVIFSLFTPSGKKSRRESRTISFTI